MKTGHIIMSINELERSDAFLKRPLLAHEKLIEVHKLKISLTVVRKLMIQDGLWNPQRKRVYQLRERRPREGELVQIDGSPLTGLKVELRSVRY